MGGSIRLGSLLGFEIKLDLSWFLVLCLTTWSLASGVFPAVYHFNTVMSWALGFAAAILLFVSVLIHELSHALVARQHGIEVTGITLFLFGGVAQLKDEPPSPRSEFLIAGVGPLTSMALGVATLGLSLWLPLHGMLRPAAAVLNYLGIVNIALAVFNLVPGFPLDGGRLLRSTIWHFTGSLREATRWASMFGQGFGYLMIGYGVFRVVVHEFSGLWMVFVGWFLSSAAQSAYQQLLLQRALCGVPVSDLMTNDVPQVDGDMRIPEFVTGYVLQHDYSTYPVLRHGEFMGVVSIEDVRHLDRAVWGVTCVGALAHQPDEERMVAHNQDAWYALKQMVEYDAPRLLVINEGRLQGIVSRDAIMRLVQMEARPGLAR